METRLKMTDVYRNWPQIYRDIRLEPLTSRTLPDALAIVWDFFSHRGNLFASTDDRINLDILRELQEIFINTSRDGLSMTAIDFRRRKVIAVAFNKIHVTGEPSRSFYEFYYDRFKCHFSRQILVTLTQMGYKTYNPDTSKRCILEMVAICDRETRTDELTYKRLLDHTVEIGNMLAAGIPIRIPVAIRGDSALTHDKYIPNLITAVTFSKNQKDYIETIGFSSLIEFSMSKTAPDESQMRENRSLSFMVKSFYPSKNTQMLQNSACCSGN